MAIRYAQNPSMSMTRTSLGRDHDVPARIKSRDFLMDEQWKHAPLFAGSLLSARNIMGVEVDIEDAVPRQFEGVF